MTPEERLAIGAALHAFWVHNYHRDAGRLDRTLRIAQRDGVVVPTIGKEDLIANKHTVGRPQDLADVAELEKIDQG
jgi:hypothetical protein